MPTGDIRLIGAFAIVITILVLVVWGISIFVNARTRREAQRLELHTRLLERVGSTREFAEFLSTDDGQRFLDAITLPATRPQWRLVWGLQGGIVLTTVGFASFLAGAAVGWLIMAIGVAFIVAFLLSWRVARAFGLVESVRSTSHRNMPTT